MKTYKLSEGSSLILDLIRGLSAQVVVIGHGISYFGILTFLHEPNFPWMQNIAVLIFFLLSGFLISYSTIRKTLNDNSYGFNQYFIDRFSRIYTAFIPSLVFVIIIDLVSQNMNPVAYKYSSSFDIRTLIGNLFMLQDYPIYMILSKTNIISGDYITSLGSARPFWTLAIEWWIYLCFGYLILVIFKKDRLTLLNLAVLAFLSVIPVYNLIMGRGNGLTVFWIFGSLLYIIVSLDILKGVSNTWKVLLILLFSALGLARAYLVMEAYDAVFAFLLAMVLWLAIDLFKDKNIPEKLASAIKYNASYSYTLYLVHYSILDFMETHFLHSANPYLLLVIGFIVTNIVSILLGRYTELALTQKVKDFLYKKYVTTK